MYYNNIQYHIIFLAEKVFGVFYYYYYYYYFTIVYCAYCNIQTDKNNAQLGRY
jgi:hypothetical protein